MPNILLTQSCVRSCPYCFAKKHMSDSPPSDRLSWEDLIYLADLVQNSGEENISLLGGEPSLHPQFIDFMVYLLERDFRITVFTSGIMGEKRLMDLECALGNIQKDRLTFVCNLNDPAISPASEISRVQDFLRRLGRYVTPGFNIHQTEFDLGFIVDTVNRFGLKRGLRLGLAHPIPGVDNVHIKIKDIPGIVERLFSFMPLLERMDIGPGIDCGFPMCAFSDEQLGRLFKLNGPSIRFGCGPAVDIGPDMAVWSCFPLSDYHKRSVFEFDSIKEIHDFYEARLKDLRVEAGGIYEACDGCNYREKDLCSGGCAAHLLKAFLREEPVRIREIYQ